MAGAAGTAGAAHLLTPPEGAAFTNLTLFVCTYVAELSGLRIGFAELTRLLCRDPQGCLLAVNSNFGHAAQRGFERHIKAPRPPRVRQGPTRGRARKVQGDGTCFNSAVEPVIALPGSPPDKVYYVKCFSTTGVTQVPGVVRPDLSDGHEVLVAFVGYLNALNLENGPVAIEGERPKMLNYKFQLRRSSPRLLVSLHGLCTVLLALEAARAVEGGPSCEGVPSPPYAIRETKQPTDDVKVSFRFRCAERAPRVNIFQEGKVNILGADSQESAQRIYDYFERLFAALWPALVCLQPERDVR